MQGSYHLDEDGAMNRNTFFYVHISIHTRQHEKANAPDRFLKVKSRRICHEGTITPSAPRDPRLYRQ